MKVIDNSPIFEPAEGILVVESGAAAEAFEPNNYYVTPDCGEVDCISETVKVMNSSKQVNQYVMKVENVMPDISSLPVLRSAIEAENANIVLALYTPCRKERYFVVGRVEKGDELRTVGLMAYSAERITKYCLQEAAKIFAILDPEQFLESTHNVFSTARFVKEYLSEVPKRIVGGPSFGMAPSMPNIKEALDIDGILTHKQRRVALDDMEKYLVDNIKIFKREAATEEEKAERRKAEAEIDLVCRSIDSEAMKKIFAIMTPSQRERAIRYIDPREVAKMSKMILSIEPADVKCIGSRSTDGYYRLMLKKGTKSLPVHFGRRASVVLYTIYMIDRYRKQEVDTLSLRQHEDSFVNLYEKFYHKRDEGIEKFKELWQKYDRRPQVYGCLNDIRQTLTAACKQMDEIASPYILETEYSHLYVERTKLSIPTELLEQVS